MQRKKSIEPGQLVVVDGLEGIGILMTTIEWMYSNVRYGDNPEVKEVEHASPIFSRVLINEKLVKVFTEAVAPLKE